MINLKGLEAAILANGLIRSWSDGLFTNTQEEKDARAKKYSDEAKANFIKMMESPKNNKTVAYENWAINKALGLSSKIQRNTKTQRQR